MAGSFGYEKGIIKCRKYLQIRKDAVSKVRTTDATVSIALELAVVIKYLMELAGSTTSSFDFTVLLNKDK
jgi:hypothetical protein